MEAGLSELHDLATLQAAADRYLSVRPVRRYRLQECGKEIVEVSPEEPHE